MPVLSTATNVNLNYCTSGNGDPTWLFFNGASLPLEIWDPLVAPLSSTGRVVRFDQRDCGRTRATGTFTLLDVAADGIRLLDHLGIAEAIFVGHAWGGRVAQLAARDYPHRTRGLVVCGTGGRFPPRLDPPMQHELRDAFQSRCRERWEVALAALYFADGFRDRQPDRFTVVADLLWEPARVQHAAWDERVAPCASYWGTARVPTLLLYGNEDRFGTPQHGEDLAERIPGAELHVLQPAGHSLIHEADEQILDALTTFASTIR